jgi:NADH-quinone oxidoreductase subunit J
MPLAGGVGALIALEMALVLMRGFQLEAPATGAKALEMGNTRLLGIEIYTGYLYPLQLAAVLLLVAIIAAIALTLRARRDGHYINPADQVRVKKADRLRLVKLAPTIEQPSPPPPAPADGGKT